MHLPFERRLYSPLPVTLTEEWVATFYIYGDESGKMKGGADYTSFCGYIAHVSEWERFSLEWNNCRFRWQVPPIHMTRIMFPDNKDDEWLAIKKKWGADWEARRDLMLKDFAATIRSAHIVCVGAVVDSKHFRSIADKDPLFTKLHKDPIHLAFHMFVMRGIEKTEIVDKHSPISIVVDEDPEFSMKVYEQLNGLKRTFSKVQERVHAVCFGNDVSYPGLQAADMLAYESRRLMVEKMKNPTTASEASELFLAMTLYLTHQPKFFTPDVLDALYASMKQGITDGRIKLD